MDTTYIKMLLPLIIVFLIVQIYCIRKILKEGVRNLNKPVWIMIVLFVNMGIGAILYLLFGRVNEND
jgi:uncharacterized membrane protein YhhN